MYTKVAWGVFSVLVGLFVVAVSPLKDLLHISGDFRNFVPYLGVLGALLVASAVAARINKLLRSFLITAGASALGWPISLYLHNLLISFFPTEPVTYVLVFFILPVWA